jgi:hypothetical protein
MLASLSTGITILESDGERIAARGILTEHVASVPGIDCATTIVPIETNNSQYRIPEV